MKRFLSLLLVFLSLAIPIPAFAATGVNATVTSSGIFVNGRQVRLNGFGVSGNNYFKLRGLAEVLSGTSSQFDVAWDGERNAVEIITGKPYTPDESNTNNAYYFPGESYTAIPSTSKIFVDGIEQSITAYTIDGSNYFKLRDLGELIPFDVEWDGANNRILIFTKATDNAYRVKTAFEARDNTVSSSSPRWKSTIRSYLIDNKDGTISVLEAKIDTITIEKYDQQYNLISQQSIDFELPIFGCFYSGEKYNYIAYGQENPEEDDDQEVIRIVRYDKAFQRVDSISVYGGQCFTVYPFDAGSGKMAEHGNTLVFHTSRKRYITEDGLNHQSQLTLIIDTEKMRVLNDLGWFQSNHVSHSFDQYVQFDGSSHVLVDHGDAYPRSVVLHKGSYTGKSRISYDEVDLFAIPGETGANCTGVSIGGFEISSDSYIVAMNSIDHSLAIEYTDFIIEGAAIEQRDIIVCSLPKDKFNGNHVKQIILAQYSESEKFGSIPQLVKISDDKMMVLWQEFDFRQPEALKYVFIDGNGEPCSEVKILDNFRLSECKPIVFRDSVVWYTNENGSRYFYSIPLTDTGLYPLDPSPTLTPTPTPGSQADSYFEYTTEGNTAVITGLKPGAGGLSDLKIPSVINGLTVVGLGEEAFSGEYFNSITIPDTVEKIGYMCFYGTRVKEGQKIYIPKSVKFISSYGFSYMNGVEAFEVDPQNAYYTSEDGVLFKKDKKVLLNYPLSKKDEIYFLPPETELMYCTCFGNCINLNKLVLQNKFVKRMGYTFFGCDMTLYGDSDCYTRLWMDELTERNKYGKVEFGGPYIGLNQER